ncbi:TetR/AcrR family transcriptional regulator [Paraburkholderia bryophila]|uniref:TetR/AcrR family transcriptional regulator n=1 Tax=Paraburkholderia bryophila TaxID=420952 RepID=UPI0023498AC3|nr:TetR/AcrR family transcriptional regulator [Paraburkholderia bryophila]WCM23643.1 TetR/AcrR family transcriptional regulator [Paraburkholderia bryophila]
MHNSAIKQGSTDHLNGAKPDVRPSPRRKREQRIRDIIDAARQVFQEDGYAGFAIRRVADRVGITHGNLQYYFRTTEDLLRTALPAYMSRLMEDYTAIANRPAMSHSQRCSALINRIFQNINETDLPKFMVEIWAFASHEAYVAELLDDMQARFRGIFAKLLSELHPTLSSEECLVRAAVICALMDGMTLFASHGDYPGRDSVELGRVAKRTVKKALTASAATLKSEVSLRRSNTLHGMSDARRSVSGSNGHLKPAPLELRARQSAQDSYHYRPTAQDKRREVKVNEIISTAANLLAAEGYANFTLARVARELGMLSSALQNYFPTHDDLLRSTMEALGQVYLDRYSEMGKPNNKPATERMLEIAAETFDEACVPGVQQLVAEVWALAQHSEITREIVRNGYAAYRVVWAELIRELDALATARECLARATLITALLDGVAMLRFEAQHQPVSEDRAFKLVMVMTVLIAQGRIAANDVP